MSTIPKHNPNPRLNVVILQRLDDLMMQEGKKVYRIPHYRGVDKRVYREFNTRYNGAALRQIRATKGVGRPCLAKN